MTATTAAPAYIDMKPALGFLGVGWIGLDRMKAVLKEDLASARLICDPSAGNCGNALGSCSGAKEVATLEEMLESDVDGIVIATPSALHAEQSIRALEAGKAVFCQKPLGRDLRETSLVVDAARSNNRLLGVDHSYRHTRVVQALDALLKSGELGEIYSVECVFHNAYGPDKQWFYDPKLSGGGCMMDLGIHLLDLVIMLFDAPTMEVRHTQILAGARPVSDRLLQVEDHASALLITDTGMNVRLETSWNAPVGRDADIRIEVLGSMGGGAIRNVQGSFYDLRLTRHYKNNSTTLVEPPDEWGGRALKEWTRALAAGQRFDPHNSQFLHSARLLDEIYSWRP